MFKRGTTYELGAPMRKKHSAVKRLFILLVVLIVLIAGGMIVVRRVYDHDLQAVSSDQTAQVITVKTGSSSSVIANQLEKAKLIRSAWAFELYVHSKELGNQLQAGTYLSRLAKEQLVLSRR